MAPNNKKDLKNQTNGKLIVRVCFYVQDCMNRANTTMSVSWERTIRTCSSVEMKNAHVVKAKAVAQVN